MKAKVLIVDDDPKVLEALNLTLSDVYEVLLASSGAEAIEHVQRHGDIAAIVLDIKMAKMDGFETASRIKEAACEAPIIFHTGYPGDYSKDQVIRNHNPFGYLDKTASPKLFQEELAKAVESWRLAADKDYLRIHALKHYGMIGNSRKMLEIFRQVEQIAPSSSNVVLLGNSGTGKSIVAKAIHCRSSRATKEFRTFSCTPRQEGLLESELFGHKRGSFTNAIADRKGLFELADGGTVLLDEVADLDLSTQSKLLMVLQTGFIQPIGAEGFQHVDVRVICATNRDLLQAVKTGNFREDLYFRIWGIAIRMPDLKERREDILPLVDYFTLRICDSSRIDLKYFDRGARDLLVEYDWPGNVREVEKVVESAIANTASYLITRQDIEKHVGPFEPIPKLNGAFRQRVLDYERIIIQQGLDKYNHNVAKLAQEFGMDASNLRKRIRDLAME